MRFLVFIFALLLCGFHLLAQETTLAGQLTSSVLPMAPNAAALSKFTDVNISYYTGRPQISIPIYEIKSRSLSIPVGLSYHASGIGVDDIASWVGLAWALNAGGSISRTVRGLADESNFGFLTQGYRIENPGVDCDNSNLKPCDYLRNVFVNNVIDSEPDLYFLNLPAGNGVKFTFDYNGNMVLQNYRQIQITRVDNTLAQWTVIMEDGTRYYLGEDGDYGGKDKVTNEPEDGGSTTSISSCHLNKIVSADGMDNILFKYGNSDGFFHDSSRYQSFFQRDVITANVEYYSTPLAQDKITGSVSSTQRLISEIIFNDGSINFIPADAGRVDNLSGKDLSQVDIKRKSGLIIKSIKLKQSGMGSGSTSRLRLDEVQEFDAAGIHCHPIHWSIIMSPSLFMDQRIRIIGGIIIIIITALLLFLNKSKDRMELFYSMNAEVIGTRIPNTQKAGC